MSNYGQFERKIAEVLTSYPFVKASTKRLYQIINYTLHKKRGFSYSLHPKVQFFTPEKWSKIHNAKQELFFGYYDKSPWNVNMTRMLFHEIREDRKVNIIVFDKEIKNKYTVGTSCAWNFQQGSMAQWIPGRNDQIVFNDVKDRRLVARTISLVNGKETIHPFPVQAVHPKRKEYLSLNYKRLSRLRPDYGYWQEVENFSDNTALDQDGIWCYDIQSGKSNLIISLEQLSQNINNIKGKGSDQKVNHIIYSPSGDKFVFMHRWFTAKGKFSRLYVANSDGTDLKLLLDDRMISHYQWRDDRYIVAWARTNEFGNHYYLINVINGSYDVVGHNKLDFYGDGHPSFSPNKRWMITDTYPNKARIRHLILYDTKENEVIEIGRFLSPLRFEGQKRCDLHPRWSPDGNFICIDSVHEGIRKSYILNVSRF